MDLPIWTDFKSADVDPSGPCCLLESAWNHTGLPRNYIWTIGYLGQWKGAEEAEVSAQVKSYGREWLLKRAQLLDQKKEEATRKQQEYLQVRDAEQRKRLRMTDEYNERMHDMDAINQRIENGPLGNKKLESPAPKRQIEAGFGQMAKSLVKTAADLATGGVTDPKERMEVCNSCPFKGDDGRCGKCGCVLAAKTRVKKATCPIGRW